MTARAVSSDPQTINPYRQLLFAVGGLLLAASGLLPGCVSLEQLPPGAVAGLEAAKTTVTSYPDIDAGGTSITSLHFTLRGYSETDIRPVSLTAETFYNKIGADIGLYTYLASQNFTMVIYKDQEEYLKKTRLPAWSRAVTAGKTIYTYPGSDLEPALIHEMVHLVFDTYMGDKAGPLRWLREGLAVHEELSRCTESERMAYLVSKRDQLRAKRQAFSQMTFFIPNTEERRLEDPWYQQVESVVSYLLAQAGALNFAQMLNDLRSGIDIDRALFDAYPGKFRNFSELESAWKYTI